MIGVMRQVFERSYYSHSSLMIELRDQFLGERWVDDSLNNKSVKYVHPVECILLLMREHNLTNVFSNKYTLNCETEALFLENLQIREVLTYAEYLKILLISLKAYISELEPLVEELEALETTQIKACNFLDDLLRAVK